MTKLKRYKVWAKMTTYLYDYVDAENYEDAERQANELDGGTFKENDSDWDVYSVELETKETT